MKPTPIDNSKKYTLYALIRLKAFYWFPKHTITLYRSTVMKDLMGENILKTTKVQGKHGSQYQIKGSNLIKFLNRHAK